MKLTCFRISNGALAAKDLPRRLKVLSWGDNPACFGLNVRMGEHTRTTFPKLMRQRNLDRVAIDFEHNTVKGTPAHAESGEPRKVAAYGTPMLVPGDGLFLDDIDWTPCGRENALNFIDLSPAAHIEERTGEVDLLHSVALTRAGAIEGLSFFSVDAKGDITMDWKKWLLDFLKMPEETADEALAEALTERIKAVATEVVAASVAAAAAGAEAITTLSADLAAVRGEVTTLQGEIVRRDREGIVAQAAREGKVIPLSAEQVAGMAPALLAEMAAKLPVTVPMDRRTPEHVTPLSVESLTVLDRVAKACGMTAEQVRKANG